jgi:hypothetical protein
MWPVRQEDVVHQKDKEWAIRLDRMTGNSGSLQHECQAGIPTMTFCRTFVVRSRNAVSSSVISI